MGTGTRLCLAVTVRSSSSALLGVSTPSSLRSPSSRSESELLQLRAPVDDLGARSWSRSRSRPNSKSASQFSCSPSRVGDGGAYEPTLRGILLDVDAGTLFCAADRARRRAEVDEEVAAGARGGEGKVKSSSQFSLSSGPAGRLRVARAGVDGPASALTRGKGARGATGDDDDGLDALACTGGLRAGESGKSKSASQFSSAAPDDQNK
jgi:hypothetical protein